MEIQWYPGHMAKAKRQLSEMLPLFDVVVEVCDARIPISSRNPDLDRLLTRKPRVVVLNKSDLANPNITEEWLKYIRGQGYAAVAVNSRTGQGMADLRATLRSVRPKNEKIRRTARRVGVVGIPNSGKSTILNQLVGRSAAQAGDRPGVTRGKQWVRVGEWEILDTPGLLWPKFEDKHAALLLAFTGAIRHELFNEEELALELIAFLKEKCPGCLAQAYSIEEALDHVEVLQEIAKKRGCLKKGGVVDELRGAKLLWGDFRSGRLGRITLESPIPS
ncbi:MAG TPA: ribosome biogenesis GTPase YlqF [Bacillota bacterium]|nr:ribosome biogenesis GTPase YlqF [Bacillota bacterium]